MKKQTEENISALMDNDLSAEELNKTIDQLCADESLRKQWQRMHLARDVVQGEPSSDYLGSGFCTGVMAALEAEKTPVLADESNVVEGNFGSQPKTAKPSAPWMRPLAGLAVAASVAMVSVLGLKLIQEPNLTSLPAIAETDQNNDFVAETSVAQLPFQPTSNADFKRVNNSGTYWVVDKEKVRDSELETHLNSYLSDHIEFATMRNVGGVLPYSKLVGYDEIRK